MDLPINEIICGDNLAVMAGLPDGCVQCCVTSPPYWGLRDYGTATWDGGQDGCDHRLPGTKTGRKSTLRSDGRDHIGPYDGERPLTVGYPFRDVCGKCGARRIDDQIGLEPTPDEYVAKMVEVFSEVRRVLRDDGTLWLNLGDSYASSPASGGVQSSRMTGAEHKRTPKAPYARPPGPKPKDLVGIPWRVAFALQADGWYLRSDIIWHKPSPTPESVTDRPTKAHEYIFLMSKSARYFYDAEAIKEESADVEGSAARYKSAFGGAKNEALLESNQVHTRPIGMREFDGRRNKRSVWTVTTQSFTEAHFATFPPDLIRPCILAGCPEGGVVLDPFSGAGTTAHVARLCGRRYIGIELNPEYVEMSGRRLSQQMLFWRDRSLRGAR